MGKTLNFHSASLHPGVYMNTGKLNAGGNPAMHQHLIQGGGGESLLVASCYWIGDERQPGGPLNSYAGFCTFSKVFVVEFSSGKNWNLTKVFLPVEVKFYQPSCVGLPLKFSLESVLFLRVNTTVKAEVQPKFFIPLPDQVTVSGKMNIRYDLEWQMELSYFSSVE